LHRVNGLDGEVPLTQAQGDLEQASDISDGDVSYPGFPNSFDFPLQQLTGQPRL
jgi:hypothetical protein